MSRRGAGVAFCAIAAFLFATRYLCAAILRLGTTQWDSETFPRMLYYIGNPPLILSIVALAIGAVYIVWGEFEGRAARQE